MRIKMISSYKRNDPNIVQLEKKSDLFWRKSVDFHWIKSREKSHWKSVKFHRFKFREWDVGVGLSWNVDESESGRVEDSEIGDSDRVSSNYEQALKWTRSPAI